MVFKISIFDFFLVLCSLTLVTAAPTPCQRTRDCVNFLSRSLNPFHTTSGTPTANALTPNTPSATIDQITEQPSLPQTQLETIPEDDGDQDQDQVIVQIKELSDHDNSVSTGSSSSSSSSGSGSGGSGGNGRNERKKVSIPKTDLCSICISEFKENDMVTRTKCQHLFHDDCIKCMQESAHPNRNKCPICRKTLLENCARTPNQINRVADSNTLQRSATDEDVRRARLEREYLLQVQQIQHLAHIGMSPYSA
eukprot:Pgem_evm1s7108